MAPKELHRKHRPEYLDDVLGQDAAVKSIKKTIERQDVHAYLLTGSGGVGKTSIARIIAQEVGCELSNILEVDAAANSGVDAMRAINETVNYRPFGKSAAKAVIIDECHSLSKQAWQTLLKPVEEPADHLYWFLCTTEASKVPTTIRTRCSTYALKDLTDAHMEQMLDKVLKIEKIKLAAGVRDVLMKSHRGSGRLMLTNLATVRDSAGRAEAAELLKVVLETDAVIELCRFLVQGGSWVKCMSIYKKLEGQSPEGVRIVVMNYMASVLKGAANDAKARKAAEIMEAFCEEYRDSEKSAPLLLSLSRALLAQ